MNEVIFTIQKCIDCPESMFWKVSSLGDVYVCGARSKFSGNYNINDSAFNNCIYLKNNI